MGHILDTDSQIFSSEAITDFEYHFDPYSSNSFRNRGEIRIPIHQFTHWQIKIFL